MSISLIVMGGILAAYLFVGRNLTRLVNLQQQEVQSRRALREFTQDLSAGSQLTAATATQVQITKPIASGTTSVTYTYSSASGTLARADAAGTRTLLSGLTSFAFTYYTETGNAVTGATQSVKSVEFTFASATGTAAAGTRASYASVSPRVVLRNKPALQ